MGQRTRLSSVPDIRGAWCASPAFSRHRAARNEHPPCHVSEIQECGRPRPAICCSPDAGRPISPAFRTRVIGGGQRTQLSPVPDIRGAWSCFTGVFLASRSPQRASASRGVRNAGVRLSLASKLLLPGCATPNFSWISDTRVGHADRAAGGCRRSAAAGQCSVRACLAAARSLMRIFSARTCACVARSRTSQAGGFASSS